ncbi:copper chaperone [Orbilia oligospora]|uniref:Superoxide dismutase 1 copper chaperone n=1 Tax=Orbilia oligospora TaxID=2813651 RepID=A0A7C8UI87_ORBOL|nr:copper chaperone [Orbilia oligospora]KAF3197146.1 copper chaperone [Orbilia oligospora]KAF3205246.1 copper chaperone [Orbilia oligospora]
MRERPPFKTLFAVPLHCEGCTNSVKNALSQVEGILNVDCHLEQQLVEVEGTAAPSKISASLREAGKDCILRGTGNPNSAAVCILETHAPNTENTVRGLARLVQVGPDFTIVDISLKGLIPGTYQASIRQNGDISRGAASTGGVWEEEIMGPGARGKLGQIEVGNEGSGGIIIDASIAVWELIGRSMVLSPIAEPPNRNDEATLVGVIARSAGIWENDKVVCSCSGKTVWEERVEQTEKGML